MRTSNSARSRNAIKSAMPGSASSVSSKTSFKRPVRLEMSGVVASTTFNTTGAEDADPSLRLTVIWSCPGAARSAAWTVTTSCVALTNPVARSVPLTCAMSLKIKFDPLMRTFVSADPTVTLAGLMLSIAGPFCETMKSVKAFETGAPFGFVTVIEAWPAFATSAVRMIAVRCCESRNVVIRLLPLNCALTPDMKPVPVTLSVNCPLFSTT